jgi:hypothetical protein
VPISLDIMSLDMPKHAERSVNLFYHSQQLL